MIHSLSSWWRMLMAGARSEMQYRLDFYAQLLGIVLQYGAGMATISLILGRFHQIDGWQLGELALLYALVFLTSGLAIALFLSFIEVGEVLVRGEFDRFLLRPLHPFILCAAYRFPAYSWGYVVLGFSMLVWALGKVQIAWTTVKVVYLLLTVVGGTLIQGSLMVLIGALAFWFLRTDTLYYSVVMPFRDVISYPITIFPRVLRFLFTFVIPLAFVNFFPAHVLLDRSDVLFHPLFNWATPVVGVLCFAGSCAVWQFGLTKYQGAGS